MKALLFLLLSLRLSAAPIIIDAGSDADQYCSTGGVKFGPFRPDGDGTLCYTSFSVTYPITVPEDGPYIVSLAYEEPVSPTPTRAWSVTINDQLVYPRLTSPGFGQWPAIRSAIIWSSDGVIRVRFDSLVRSALISSITVTPLALTKYIVPQEPQRETLTAMPVQWFNDNSGYHVQAALRNSWDGTGVLFDNIAVYRNGVRTPVSIQQIVGQVRFFPLDTNQAAWDVDDSVLVDMVAIGPPLPVAVE